jgi:hypothetical protein
VAKLKLVDDQQHHFIKHCKNRELIRDNGQIVGVFPSAFSLRPADAQFAEERWLSGQYFEFYDGTEAERFCACCHFIQIEMKRKDALCKMQVGAIKEEGAKRSKSLRVFHQPEPDSPGYAGLHGLPKASDPIDDELLSLLATLAALETLEISQIL